MQKKCRLTDAIVGLADLMRKHKDASTKLDQARSNFQLALQSEYAGGNAIDARPYTELIVELEARRTALSAIIAEQKLQCEAVRVETLDDRRARVLELEEQIEEITQRRDAAMLKDLLEVASKWGLLKDLHLPTRNNGGSFGIPAMERRLAETIYSEYSERSPARLPDDNTLSALRDELHSVRITDNLTHDAWLTVALDRLLDLTE